MADLFLRYLRFLLFNPKPMNQQEETEGTEGEGRTRSPRRYRDHHARASLHFGRGLSEDGMASACVLPDAQPFSSGDRDAASCSGMARGWSVSAGAATGNISCWWENGRTKNEPFIIKYPMAPRPERGARSDCAEFPHPDGHRCRLCVCLGLSGSGRSRPVGHQPLCREGQSQVDAVA